MDRILGMRLIYAERSVSRNVSFEFLNRQLVWEAFTVRRPSSRRRRALADDDFACRSSCSS